MKTLRFGSIALVIVLAVTSIPVNAMSNDTTYPWYRAYQNPAVREKVYKGYQTARQTTAKGYEKTKAGFVKTKEFAGRHKKKIIAGVVAAIFAGAVVRQAMSERVANVYEKHNIHIRSMGNNSHDVRDAGVLLSMGRQCLKYRFFSEETKRDILDGLKDNKDLRGYFHRFKGLSAALKEIMNLQK